jgi:predicted MFS family arabinose efflux permease
LAVAETLVWAGLYYFFPAMLLRWEADFGWSKAEITFAATVSLLVSAVIAPRVGRLIDRDRGRVVLVGGALLGGGLLACLPLVETPAQFIAVWIGIGVAMGGCLYEPCFAFLTHRRGLDAPRAITLITLVAGFAGTVSFPLANGIAAVEGWRAAALVFAALVVFVAAPLFWIGASARRDDAFDRPVENVHGDRGPLRAVMSGPVFWLLAIGFSTIALNHGLVVNHLLPLLDERGVPEAAAVLAISLIGPMQVAGRLLMMAVERHVGMVFVCGATFVFMALAGTVLGAAAALPALLYLFVALQGAGYGVTSITRPVVTAILLGRSGFGIVSGALALPFVTATALAPSVGSMIWRLGGYDAMIPSLVGIMLFGFGCFLAAVRLSRDRGSLEP